MRSTHLAGVIAAFALGIVGTAEAQGGAEQGGLEAAVSRPRLGLTVDIAPRPTDSIGAYVESVQPGSPAAKAGIKSGDIITRLAGKSIPSDSDGRPAGLRLISLAAQLEPNSRIRVDLRRNGRRRRVWLTTSSDISFVFKGAIHDSARRWTLRVRPADSGAAGIGQLLLQLTSPLATLETAPLNPELGRYFGTSRGVLVISNRADARLPLQGGDVVLAVAGRRPRDPAHLMRLLQARKTETRLDVFRHRKRITVTFRP